LDGRCTGPEGGETDDCADSSCGLDEADEDEDGDGDGIYGDIIDRRAGLQRRKDGTAAEETSVKRGSWMENDENERVDPATGRYRRGGKEGIKRGGQNTDISIP